MLPKGFFNESVSQTPFSCMLMTLDLETSTSQWLQNKTEQIQNASCLISPTFLCLPPSQKCPNTSPRIKKEVSFTRCPNNLSWIIQVQRSRSSACILNNENEIWVSWDAFGDRCQWGLSGFIQWDYYLQIFKCNPDNKQIKTKRNDSGFTCKY